MSHLCLDGILSDWVHWSLAQFLLCETVGISRAQGLTDGTGLLGSQVNWLILLSLVQFSQIVLCLLVHDNVDAGNSFANNTTKIEELIKITILDGHSFYFNLHLGQFGWSTSSNFSDTESQKFLFKVFELLGELFLVFKP